MCRAFKTSVFAFVICFAIVSGSSTAHSFDCGDYCSRSYELSEESDQESHLKLFLYSVGLSVGITAVSMAVLSKGKIFEEPSGSLKIIGLSAGISVAIASLIGIAKFFSIDQNQDANVMNMDFSENVGEGFSRQFFIDGQVDTNSQNLKVGVSFKF